MFENILRFFLSSTSLVKGQNLSLVFSSCLRGNLVFKISYSYVYAMLYLTGRGRGAGLQYLVREGHY